MTLLYALHEGFQNAAVPCPYRFHVPRAVPSFTVSSPTALRLMQGIYITLRYNVLQN
uniref:Uncharacterized protein n=1 Tax=Anguilla anguilla TaxID=7936 RepID=A0A0E9UBB3_ANGAN